jgi:hypothetical protein
MLAVPMPIISRLPLTTVPALAANAEAVAIVSASETSTMPAAPTSKGAMSETPTTGRVSGGKPSGRTPTSDTPRSARPNDPAAMIDRTTTTRTPGILGIQCWSPMITIRPRPPTSRAAGIVRPSRTPPTKPTTSPMKPSASTEKPKSLGSWPTMIVKASPFR